MSLLSYLGFGRKEELVETPVDGSDKFLDDYTERHQRLMRQRARYEASGAVFGTPVKPSKSDLEELDKILAPTMRTNRYLNSAALAYCIER